MFADITSILWHFDTAVIQQAYQQFNGFNFFYLFVSSVCLLVISHLCNAVYWSLAWKNIQVLLCHEPGSKTSHVFCRYSNLPLLPTMLPILLFCRLVEINKALYTRQGTAGLEALLEEQIMLENIANDIKIIGE